MISAIARWCVAVCFLTFSTAAVEAATWNYFSGPDLEVVGSVSEDAAAEMARRLALFRQVFLKTLGISRDGGPPLRVYLFETDRELHPFLPLKDGKPVESSGFFHRDLDRDTLVLHLGAGTRKTSELAFHLHAHLLLGLLTDRWPAWWREGLAEFFSTMELGANQVRLGQSPERHVAHLREHPPLPLGELFAIGRNSLSYDEGTKSGPFYATSWLLVHKLLTTSRGHPGGAIEFNQLLSNGTDLQQALIRAFQIDVAALDTELKQTARRFAYRIIQEDFESTWDARKTSTTQLAPPEIQAYLGDLLYRSLRGTEAEVCFNNAVALDPRLPLPYEGLGWLRIHQNRRAEAVEYFKQANQYGSRNALSHYYHAETLLQELSKDADNPTLADSARRELETAVQLRPNFAAGHYSLAHLTLMVGRGFEEGIPHAEAAVRLEPRNPQYLLALAGLLFYSKHLSEARAALEPLLTTETGEGYKGGAESLRDMIEEAISRKRSLDALVNSGPPPQQKEPAR